VELGVDLLARHPGHVHEEHQVLQAEQVPPAADRVDHVVHRPDGHRLLADRILQRRLEAER
jgi:hypothetical protein